MVRSLLKMHEQPDSNAQSSLKAKSKPKPKAHVRALRWLGRRDYSALELKTRLETEGYSSEEIAQAMEWLQSSQWQSDERFAASLARRRSGAYGSRLIKAELQQHQVKSDAISDALESLEQGDAQRAYAWLEKRSRGNPLTPENKAKWFRALLARGFRSDDIKDAFGLLAQQMDEGPDFSVDDV